MTTPRTPVPPAPAATPDPASTAAADVVGGAADAPQSSADPKDLEIAALKAQLIATSAASAAAAVAAQNNTVVPTAPAVLDVPLVSKTDTRTGQVQALPQTTWDLLSAADQEFFTPYIADKPADLATV